MLSRRPRYSERRQRRPKSILGTVTQVQATSSELKVRPDNGTPVFVTFGADTEVLQVPPEERDLTKAKPAGTADIRAGDRVLVSYVSGMKEARRILVMSAADITKRNEAAEQAWKTDSIFGVVLGKSGNQITIRVGTPQGPKAATVTVTGKTVLRRYAADSIKFVDAVSANVGDIAAGDQLRARGKKSEDGLAITAQEVVFGTFQTHVGPIIAINREAREITIKDAATKKPLTVVITSDSKLKVLPDFAKAGSPQVPNASAPAAGASPKSSNNQPSRLDMGQILEHLPPAQFGNLEMGEAVVVTSTRGATPDHVTAIMVIANVGFEAASEPGGQNSDRLAAILAAHGKSGMTGAGGLNLPAVLP